MGLLGQIRTVMATVCVILAFAGAQGSVHARQDNTLSAETLLQITLEARSSDSYLRMRELEELFAKSPSLATKCEAVKEVLFLSMDAGNVEFLEKYGSVGRELAQEAGDQELSIYSELAFAVIDQTNGDLTAAKQKN